MVKFSKILESMDIEPLVIKQEDEVLEGMKLSSIRVGSDNKIYYKIGVNQYSRFPDEGEDPQSIADEANKYAVQNQHRDAYEIIKRKTHKKDGSK